jgi:Holliday junction resolvase RusA-like endonuclease
MKTKTSTSKSAVDLLEHVKQSLGDTLRTIYLGVAPVPASRPRVSKWGAYYGKNYEKFRREVRDILVEQEVLTKSSAPLHVIVEIIVDPPKTTKRAYPKGDVDNYAKGPLDSITSHGSCWNDDDQIVTLFVIKRFAVTGEPSGIYVHYAEAQNETT